MKKPLTPLSRARKRNSFLRAQVKALESQIDGMARRTQADLEANRAMLAVCRGAELRALRPGIEAGMLNAQIAGRYISKEDALEAHLATSKNLLLTGVSITPAQRKELAAAVLEGLTPESHALLLEVQSAPTYSLLPGGLVSKINMALATYKAPALPSPSPLPNLAAGQITHV